MERPLVVIKSLFTNGSAGGIAVEVCGAVNERGVWVCSANVRVAVTGEVHRRAGQVEAFSVI
ncbi:hypothetical protein [Marinobacter caseinilyticus]|uniref:hypothetical protein n=1 Tax=Marinobacter caseinilyticus TaxID=2692195 RepID=UPI001407B2AE|nr:hypothetical protein [Marinobacter caseinilyticus]